MPSLTAQLHRLFLQKPPEHPAHAALQADVPFSFGVLTTETREAALARAGARGDNKGYDAAMSAVEMAHLFRELDE